MAIVHVKTVSELNDILAKFKDKITVIDFHATWCGPCHAIAPTFEAASKKYKNVNFLKCDVDDAPEIARMYSVTAMPTFIFLKGDKQVHMIRGADRAGLEASIRRYSEESGSGAFQGKGYTLGGSSTPEPKKKSSGLGPYYIFLGLAAVVAVFWFLR